MTDSNAINCYILCNNQMFWNSYALLDPCTSTTVIHRNTRKCFNLYALMKHNKATTIDWCAQELLRCAARTAPKLCAAYETPDTLFMLLERVAQHDKILVD